MSQASFDASARAPRSRVLRAGAFGVAVLAVAAIASCGGGGTGAPPNVILLVVDTLRADHLGAYGYARATSPGLDALAAEGALLETAIAPSSWSPPSHTTIVTGALPENHGVLEWGHSIGPDVLPLAARLREHGFTTALFSSHRSLARGVGRFGEGFDSTFVTNNDQDAEVLRRAADWMAGRRHPYFVQIILMTPHAPYTKYPGRLDDLFPETPPGGEREFPFVERQFVGEGGIPTSVAMAGRHDAGYYVNRYDRSVRHVDNLLARFVDRIGLRDDDRETLLVVASDHGEAFGEHDSFSHELYLYDHLVRVPLVFRWPGRIPARRVLDEPVGLVDIVPTVLGLVGADASGTDGIDLSAMLTGRVSPGDTPPDDGPRTFTGSYVTNAYQRFMVRTDGYKLLRDAPADSWELYDLEADPGERVDLLRSPDDADRVGKVFAAMEDAMSHVLADYANAIPALRHIEIAPDVREELRALGYVD